MHRAARRQDRAATPWRTRARSQLPTSFSFLPAAEADRRPASSRWPARARPQSRGRSTGAPAVVPGAPVASRADTVERLLVCVSEMQPRIGWNEPGLAVVGDRVEEQHGAVAWRCSSARRSARRAGRRTRRGRRSSSPARRCRRPRSLAALGAAEAGRSPRPSPARRPTGRCTPMQCVDVLALLRRRRRAGRTASRARPSAAKTAAASASRLEATTARRRVLMRPCRTRGRRARSRRG